MSPSPTPAITRNTIPSSVRKPTESSRVSSRPYASVKQAFSFAKPEVRAVAMLKSRFSPMPQEGEDAKLTGATRSLERRLLALNLGRSKRVTEPLIA